MISPNVAGYLLTRKVFIQTWGCPYVASLHDDFEVLKKNKWLIMRQLYKIYQ